MPSPFPGMDPYLEGYLWPDVHNALATKIRQQLAPQIQPRYVARLEVYVVEDESPESEVGIVYPDVEVMQRQQPTDSPTTFGNLATTPATATVPFLSPISVRIPTVEIRDRNENLLITCIEILSPVNKRQPGLSGYRKKRHRLHRAGVHLLEIDLLRRGQRPIMTRQLPDTDYLVALTRAEERTVDLWSLTVRDALPIVPVPLIPTDADAVLDLGTALSAIYDEALYKLSIDYNESPPPPKLSSTDEDWMRTYLRTNSST